MFLAAGSWRGCKRQQGLIVTNTDVFAHLVACGAGDMDIALFDQLRANETLQAKSETPLFEELSNALITIEHNTYNQASVLAAVRIPNDAYHKRFDEMLLRCIDFDDGAYLDQFDQLARPIDQFSAHPSELSALRVAKALDFDLVISPHHAAEDHVSTLFTKTLRRHGLGDRAFHVLALFICFTSSNPHLIQNCLYALQVTSHAIPRALLDVLGRYEPYNLLCYALIDRVEGLEERERLELAFTLFKSMDATFYGDKLALIDASGDADMKRWAALNVSSRPFVQYFCGELLAEEVSDDHLFAALDHYHWAVSTLEENHGEGSADVLSETLGFEACLRSYLTTQISIISGEEWQVSRLNWRYNTLAKLNESCRYKGVLASSPKAIDTVLDAIAETAAQSRFDDIIAARAPDLADQSNGYTSLLRPAGHRYNLYVQAKVAAAQRWFPRELARAEAGDFANWGTLTLLLQDGVQFNALCAWLLKELRAETLPEAALDALAYDALLYYPATSDLLLHARQFFDKILRSGNARWVTPALSALNQHRSNGHAVPAELLSTLKKVDTTGFKRLHLHFLEKLLQP